MLLTIDKLEPGMEVASDVTNVNHALLLAKGAILTDQYLRTLKMWGIKAVHVAGGPNSLPPEEPQPVIPTEILALAEKRVDQRLSHVAKDSVVVKVLRAAAVQSVARSLMNKAADIATS